MFVTFRATFAKIGRQQLVTLFVPHVLAQVLLFIESLALYFWPKFGDLMKSVNIFGHFLQKLSVSLNKTSGHTEQASGRPTYKQTVCIFSQRWCTHSEPRLHYSDELCISYVNLVQMNDCGQSCVRIWKMAIQHAQKCSISAQTIGMPLKTPSIISTDRFQSKDC